MLQKLGSREKFLLGVLITVLALFAFYRFFAAPQAARYTELKKQLNDTRAQVSAARQKVAMLETEEKQAEAARARAEEVMALFAGNVQDGGAVINLGLSSAACGVKIVAFKPGKIASWPYYLELPVEMEARGPYNGFLSFLDNLENNKIIPNPVKINALAIEPAKAMPAGAGAAGALSPALLPGTVPGQPEDAAAETETGVTAKMTLVFYSEPTPKGKLALEQVANWKVGRPNLFRTAEMVSPYQGVKPLGTVPQEAVPPGGAGEPEPPPVPPNRAEN